MQPGASAPLSQAADTSGAPAVFLSHQGRDGQVAHALVELLVKSLGLKPSEIRCTTTGSRLPVGSEVQATLAQQVIGAQVFLCLVTKDAARSEYVRFEIKTRQQSGKAVFPVLGVGAVPGLIPELRSAVALKCNERMELTQLAREVGNALGRDLEPMELVDAAVTATIDAVSRATRGKAGRATRFIWLLFGGVTLAIAFAVLFHADDSRPLTPADSPKPAPVPSAHESLPSPPPSKDRRTRTIASPPEQRRDCRLVKEGQRSAQGYRFDGHTDVVPSNGRILLPADSRNSKIELQCERGWVEAEVGVQSECQIVYSCD